MVIIAVSRVYGPTEPISLHLFCNKLLVILRFLAKIRILFNKTKTKCRACLFSLSRLSRLRGRKHSCNIKNFTSKSRTFFVD